MPVIELKDVWEMYQIKFIIDGKISWDNFWALRGITFSMEKGETLGIIGENGSGKSTILKLMAGMLKPDRGEIRVSGSVSGLLEMGAGFQVEFTGRENIFLQCELFGLRIDETKKKFQTIVNFAEIGKFIDAPVKYYSQGMFVRLAFAIAVNMDPDIFLIDDTLAVGDEYFQKKCIKEIFKIRESGKTVVIVTHDMILLQKLCARTILLKQGMLIKDEATAKSVSLYSQAVGSPKGIAIVEKKQLSLVFNNGRLLLNWKGNLITLSSGGIYTALVVSDRLYGPNQAEWEASESEGILIVKGKFHQIDLIQVWRIEVSDNFEIKWDIEIELGKEAQLPEAYPTIMLTEEYTEWFVDSENGRFPAIGKDDKNRKIVYVKSGSNISIGVYPQKDLPSLIFEHSFLGYSCQGAILNSDYINPCRILQYKTNPVSNNPVNQAHRFICFAGKIIVNNPDINGYISKIQNQSSVSNGKLKLIFDNGRLSLFFDGIPLTKASHLNSTFLLKQKWFNSDSAQWILEKKSDNILIARGNWDSLGVSQIWRINMHDDSSFSWDVATSVRQDTEISQQRLRCAFSEDYKNFFSQYANEKFSDDFNDTEVDLLQRCISSGEAGLAESEGKLPTVTLSLFEKLGNFIKVFNSNHYLKARLLHLERVEPEEKAVYSAGQHECFSVRFTVGKDNAINTNNFDNALEDEKLKFILDKGSGRIYIKGKEITKNIGVYTSLRSDGRWHDSSTSALWKVIYRSGCQIKAIGKWLDLPLLQEWEIVIKKEGMLEFKVRLEVAKKLELDELQVNAMFSERFSQWSGGAQDGVFPEFAQDIDSYWDCLWSGKEDVGVISLKEDPKYNLPRVSLSLNQFNPQWLLKIINSDRYHRGRVLQYALSSKTIFLPGSHPYFYGTLSIQDK